MSTIHTFDCSVDGALAMPTEAYREHQATIDSVTDPSARALFEVLFPTVQRPLDFAAYVAANDAALGALVERWQYSGTELWVWCSQPLDATQQAAMEDLVESFKQQQ